MSDDWEWYRSSKFMGISGWEWAAETFSGWTFVESFGHVKMSSRGHRMILPLWWQL